MIGRAGAKPVGDESGGKRPLELRGDGEPVRAEATEPIPSRKASSETCVTVPQTDTGRRVENTEGNGRTSVKELGKIAP